MKIVSITHHPQLDLIKRLHQVTLFRKNPTDPVIYIFKNALISLDELPLSDIHPVQFYRLQESLERNKYIQAELSQKGIDIYKLDGFYTFQLESEDTTYTLLPPLVEYQKQPDGKELAIIADGFHRIALANLQERKTIQVVTIKNIPEEFSYPAWPNPKGWEDVTLEGVPADPSHKRLWRFPKELAYKHYHDFGSVFTNVSKPRST
jgi:hypothetical protein